MGLDLASAMLGSEGCLGIITSVVVKVVPLPEVSEHASFFFRNFSVSSRDTYCLVEILGPFALCELSQLDCWTAEVCSSIERRSPSTRVSYDGNYDDDDAPNAF